MLPIETVVELLIENAAPARCGGGQIMLGGDLYDSLKEDDLRGYIRTYLQSIVPAPKLLSECEEFKPYAASGMNGWLSVVARSGEYACDVMLSGRLSPTLLPASDFQVIQPVEVNRD